MSRRDQHSQVDRAMRVVHRGDFLPAGQRRRAGEDNPIPIGYDQTISQPSLVAFMTGQLALTAQGRVLEIGTGSGYQTALLAELASAVFTIERIPELAAAAMARLGRLGYRNIHYRVGDGACGWPEHAPFDAIIVTAAPETLPPALVGQLAPGGRLVAPVGPAAADQQMLLLVEKSRTGEVSRRELCPVRFVPLVSDAAPRGTAALPP